MKRILLITLFVTVMSAMKVLATDYFTENGICYFLVSGQTNAVEVGNEALLPGVVTATPYTGSIVVPATVAHESTTYNVVGVSYNAFFENKNITSVQLPEGLQSIGQSAFYGCHNLESVTLPTTLSYIAPFAFAYSGIKSVEIPAGVTAIYPHVFDSCDALETVELPATLETIDAYALFKCPKLVSMIIPASVTTIGEYALAGCTSLSTLNYKAINCSDFTNYTGSAHPFFECPIGVVSFDSGVSHIPAGLLYPSKDLAQVHSYITSPLTIDADVFQDVDKSNCKLYVPANSLASYKSAEVWKDFANILAENSSSVVSPIEDSIIIFSDGNEVVIVGAPENAMVKIYTIDGREVYMGNEVRIAVEVPGLYIVKIANCSQKVLIR